MVPLLIPLSEVYEEGITRHFVLSGGAVGMEDPDVGFAQPIALDCQLFEVNRDVVVRGTLATSLRLTCSRCAEEIVVPLQVPLEAVYLPAPTASSEREKEIEDSGADVYAYSEHVIDLREMVRDKLLLSIPLQPCCHPGCKGLCPSCGVNWNVSTCQCAQPGLGSPFHLLRELRLS
jgi:uncharacterized protein